MRKELPYFRVEGAFGGSQDWFTQDRWMKRGGCAAITATDCSLYFSLYKGRKAACPQAQGIQLRRKPAQFLTCQFPHGFPFRLSIHVWFYYTTAFSPRQAPITRKEARTQVLASLRCHISQP